MGKYYYIDSDGKHGPFSFEELSQKNLHVDTLVWRYGLERWMKLSDLVQNNDCTDVLPENCQEIQRDNSPTQSQSIDKRSRGRIIAKRIANGVANIDWNKVLLIEKAIFMVALTVCLVLLTIKILGVDLNAALEEVESKQMRYKPRY